MHTDGRFSPATEQAARERYEMFGPTAQTVVREVATAMDFEKDEYDERVTSAVVERARNALFAAALEIHVGRGEEFDDWRADHSEYEIHVIGNENVPRVVWHAPAFAETAVAATFANEERAAVETLRRQAFGRLYRDLLE
jgi:IMP cyclohydrolase